MENNLMIIDNNTIEIKQLPVLEFKDFDTIKEVIEETTKKYEDLVLDEENVKDFKDIQSQFNKDVKTLNDIKKTIKKQINAPYLVVEDQLKELMNLLETKKTNIASQLSAYDLKVKEDKKKEYTEYFNELQMVHHELDFIKLSMIEDSKWLNKGTSMKSIRTTIDEFFNQIIKDVEVIKLNPNGARIKNEYINNGFNVAHAIGTVLQKIEFEKKEQARIDRENEAKGIKVQQEDIQVEVEVKTEAPTETLTTPERVTFTLEGDVEALKEVKALIYKLKDEGKLKVV